jgi:radical SAM protein (TIGR01212 family)
MIEAGAKEVNEEDMLKAIEIAHEEIKKMCDFIDMIAKEIGKEKFSYESIDINHDLFDDVEAMFNEQVKEALLNAGKDEMFVAYFQNFTNTYAPTSVLRERYDAALIDDRIKVLAIGTRPDCIDEEICALIAEYKKRLDVWVELGLQTSSDKTADVINRGYHRDVFERAMELLSKYGIPVVVHLIVGLPGEGIEEIKESVDYINRFDVFGLKIHSIYVMRGTALADMYGRGEYEPPTLSEFVFEASYILSHINPKIIVHRLTGDCPKDMLIAPDWNTDKHKIIEEINAYLKENRLYQGSLYK